MLSWQQKLKEDNKQLIKTITELQIKLAIQEKENEFLRKNLHINPDIIEMCGRISTAMGESLHSMSNFINTIERIKR
jgi:hypothetical protein